MVITYLGEGFFRLQSGESVCLVDPVKARHKAALILKTLTPTSDFYFEKKKSMFTFKDEALEISFPGAYEAHGWEVQGFPIEEESSEKMIKTGYVLRREEMSVGIVGPLRKTLDVELAEQFGDLDLLLIPANGEAFLTPGGIAKMVKQFSPHVVIVGTEQGAKQVLKTLGQEGDIQEKVVLKKKDVSGDGSRVVVLTNT